MTELRKNPLLEKVNIPGEKFRIPSGGLFYEHGELDDSVKNGEVMIYPMNAVDELHLKSPDKLLSGDAVIDVLRCCLLDVTKPEELLAKDVDFILMCLRLISYGPDFELVATHDCDEATEHKYSVPLRPIIQGTKPIDPTQLSKYQITLDGGQVVRIHPPKFLATVRLYEHFGKDLETDAEFESLGIQLIDSIAEMIRDVDEHDEKEDIKEWLKTIRVGAVRQISDKVAELSDWGLDPTFVVECKDCEKEMSVFVPINPVSFFT